MVSPHSSSIHKRARCLSTGAFFSSLKTFHHCRRDSSILRNVFQSMNVNCFSLIELDEPNCCVMVSYLSSILADVAYSLNRDSPPNSNDSIEDSRGLTV